MGGYSEIRVIHHFSGTFRQELVPFVYSLVVLDTISIISIHLWCMVGGSV